MSSQSVLQKKNLAHKQHHDRKEMCKHAHSGEVSWNVCTFLSCHYVACWHQFRQHIHLHVLVHVDDVHLHITVSLCCGQTCSFVARTHSALSKALVWVLCPFYFSHLLHGIIRSRLEWLAYWIWKGSWYLKEWFLWIVVYHWLLQSSSSPCSRWLPSSGLVV